MDSFVSTVPTTAAQTTGDQPPVTDIPTRIDALEKSVADLAVSVANFVNATENVAAPATNEFNTFVDGLFSKYFRGEWEAFKAKLAANEKFGKFATPPATNPASGNNA